MLNKDLTQQDAIWLLEEYTKKRNGRIDGNTMDNYFVLARSLMIGKQSERPGCACQFKAYVMLTNNMFGQYEEEIKAIAYPPKTTSRARKTSK